MQHIDVTSSNLKSVAWEADGDSGTLQIAFKPKGDEQPRVYQYSGVDYEEYKKLLNAKSPGSHFSAFIRNRYEGHRIDTPKEGKCQDTTTTKTKQEDDTEDSK